METQWRVAVETDTISLRYAVERHLKNGWKTVGDFHTWKDWGRKRQFGQVMKGEFKLVQCECGVHRHVAVHSDESA